MYFGSVRFFKHLILATLALMIIVPTTLAVFFGVKLRKQTDQLARLETQLHSTLLPQMEHIEGVDYSTVIVQNTYDYQLEYPDLYVEETDLVEYTGDKPVIYLTFDDGPSRNTEQVLDILKANDIKATFFVVNNNISAQQHLYKRIVDEGHTIGVHTYSHQYNKIYTSVDEYLADFYQMYTKVYEMTGVKPTIFRFPGGSINVYNQDIYVELIAEMLRRGFTYYDWNVASGDAGETYTSAQILNAVTSGVGNKERSIVLMHDSSTKYATVAALQSIIDTYKETHEFRALDNTVVPTVFTYKDNNVTANY